MGRFNKIASRLHRLTPKRLALLIEATILLLLARVAINLLPFKYLMWYFKRHIKHDEVFGLERENLLTEVRCAIERAARLLPGSTVCFPRGIAVQLMLLRRGVCTTLYYGSANLAAFGLTSHVWVKDGEKGVVGEDCANVYHILARYPNISRCSVVDNN